MKDHTKVRFVFNFNPNDEKLWPQSLFRAFSQSLFRSSISDIASSNEEELNERTSVLRNEIYKYDQTNLEIEETEGKIEDILDDITKKGEGIPKGKKMIEDAEIDIEAENANIEYLLEEQEKIENKT